MNDRFESVFDDVLAANQSGEIRNLLIADNNEEFKNCVYKSLYYWSKKHGIRVIGIDESDEAWMTEVHSGKLYEMLSFTKTVLLVNNYATYSFHNEFSKATRSFIRNIALNRSYISDSSASLELPNLSFVIAINDLSEMYWKEAEYSCFSIMHEDDEKCTWVNTNITRPDTQMHPVMSRENRILYSVSDDQTTLCFDAGDAFGGRVLKRPLRYYTANDLTEIIHNYIENNLPDFHDKVVCLILKMSRFDDEVHFVIDGRRLKKSFPNLGSICCKDVFEIADMEEDLCILDPFELGEMCFNLAQDGDIPLANLFVRDLWALDRRWARFFREVAKDYYRKPEDHANFDPDSALHNWTGMDNLFRIYWLGWYHAGDDFFDEEDKVYAIFNENFNKAVDLLPVRFQNCSADEIAEKLYWDIRHAENDERPGYFNFGKILREAERICPGVQDKMCQNGWLTKDMGSCYITKRCNMCGKTFNFWDNQENFCLDQRIGFGSSYDLHRIRLNLCCQCFDKVMDWIIPQCEHNPMSEYH